MDAIEILIRLSLGVGCIGNGIAGIIQKRTQFYIGRSAPGIPVNFQGEAAVILNVSIILCGLFFCAAPVIAMLAPGNPLAEDTSIFTFLAFAVLFLGLILSAVIQLAVNLGEFYRATMDRDSEKASPPDSE